MAVILAIVYIDVDIKRNSSASLIINLWSSSRIVLKLGVCNIEEWTKTIRGLC